MENKNLCAKLMTIKAATVFQKLKPTGCDTIPHLLVRITAWRDEFHLSIQTIRSKYPQWNKAFVH